jgi:hypothetical protein
MLDLLNQLGESDQSTKVEISKHKFDDEDELDLDNLDL